MATTTNYLGVLDGLSIYNADGDRQDVTAYPAINWSALNASLRVTDATDSILDITYYGLEVLPTNPDPVTLYIHNVPMVDSDIHREMLFHCQVKSSIDIQTTTSLYETGQPIGELVPIVKSCPREQFTAIRSNILPLSKGGSVTTHTFTYEGTEITNYTYGTRYATVAIDIANHDGNIIFVTIPALVNHLDFYKNSFVRSARNYIPDIYWQLDFEQSDPQYPMFKLLDALTNTSNDVMQLFSNWFDHELTELAPGLTGTETWTQSALTSPARATDANMGWLSQFTGSELKSNITGTDQPAGTVRDFYTTAAEIEAFLKWQLENSYYGRAAGTREAMVSAVQRVLSGNKNVAIIPHFGAHAWKIQIQTLRSETQDFDASTYSSDDILDVVADASPMGYEIFHLAVLFFAFTLGNVGLGRLGLGVLGGPGGYVPPDAPTGLTLSAGGTPSTELTLTWVAPSYNGGDAVSGYVIRRDGSIIVANTGNTNVTYTNTGLTPGTTYSYTVAAINGAGAGDQSTSASASTDAVVANAPTGLTLTAGSTPSSMINLSWTAPTNNGGAAIVGYRITENNVVVVSNTGSSSTTHLRTGLTRVTAYTYKVAAINSAGIGSDCTPASLTTAAELPGAPTGLTLTAGSPANTVIALAWTAPTATGGAAISGYQIKKNGSIVVADTGSTATTYSATGLTHNTTYTFTVAAINSAGAGGDSTTESRDTLPNGIGATGGTITTYGNYKIHTFPAGAGVGTFEITSNLNNSTFDVLMVSGGGGGGTGSSGFVPSYTIVESAAGGGGGGGVRAETGQTGTVASYSVTVGDGGPAGTGNGGYGTMGYGTRFGSLYVDATNDKGGASGNGGGGTGNGSNAAAGGGSGAGSWWSSSNAFNSGQGGSNGGTGGGDFNYGGDGGDAEAAGQSLSGGTVHIATGGGGGGFYGNDGDDGVVNYGSSQGGDGGDGVANDWQTGSTQYYGGGGGGGLTAGNTSTGANWTTYPQAQGGSGGGGDGGVTYEDANDNWQTLHTAEQGTDGLGGGGGASAWGGGTSNLPIGGRGGHGVVVVRYSTT